MIGVGVHLSHALLVPLACTIGLVMMLRRSLILPPVPPVGLNTDLITPRGMVGVSERDAPDQPSNGRFLTLRLRSRVVSIPLWQVGVTGLSLAVAPMLALGLAVLIASRALSAPRRLLRLQQRQWAVTVPDLVELVRLALGSGCTAHLSLLLIADNAGGATGDMLRRTAMSLREGTSVSESLVELQDRVGTPVRPLCSALLGSERYGLPLSATLEALAVEARLARRRDAELRSRRLPVLLIFPLVVCILPAFALLTVVPLLGGGLSSLSW
jgi:pilus assembly protein TadC